VTAEIERAIEALAKQADCALMLAQDVSWLASVI
jgi:hypothetical protein